MPAGFQVVGTHGVVQVDENFINLGLTAKGAVTIPAASGAMGRASVTVTGNTPILCIRPVSTYAGILSVTKSGNQFTFNLVGGTTGAGGAAVQDSFNWYVFDKMQPGSVGSVGLEVRDANGVTTFNSNFSPMIISAIGAIPAAPMSTTPAVIDTGVARTYAACLSEGRLQVAPFGSAQSLMFSEIVKVTSTGARTSYGVVQTLPPEVSFDSGGGQILLVDVTGL